MGQKGAHVPRFGSWDSDDHMPFTKVFDNARAGKGGRPLNPNDPMENPEAFGLSPGDASIGKAAVKELSVESDIPSAKARAKETRHQQEAPARKQTPETQAQRFQRDASHQNSRAAANGSPSRSPSDHPPRRGEISRGASAPNGDSPRTVDRSQGRPVNKPSAGAPAMERRTSADGGTAFPPGTPQRIRLRSTSSLPKPEVEKAPTLPKFGDWNGNLNDPSAGQGFTMIFDSVRNERKTGGPAPVQVPDNGPETPINQQKPANKWYCCFGPNKE